MVEIIVKILWNVLKWIWQHTRWIGILILILIIEVIIFAVASNENVDWEIRKPDLEVVDCQVERVEDKGYRLYVKIANNGSELCRYIPSVELYMDDAYTQKIYLSADSIYPEDAGVEERIPAGRTVEATYAFLDIEEVNEGSIATLVLSGYDLRTEREFKFRFVVEESA